MNAFYQKNISEEVNSLPEEEAKHCIQVLRHKIGDEVLILDGIGGKHIAVITDISKKSCQYQITSSSYTIRKKFRIHLAIAPTKNIDRMQWLVEKLTEIGVDEVSLIQTQNSERRKIRMDRLEKKALSALKQSKNPFLPKINGLMDIDSLINNSSSDQKLIAHVAENHMYIGEALQPNKDVTILIGPEGDFSEKEVSTALKNGFIPVSLGSNTLRTETAGLTACCATNLLNKY